MAKVLANMNLFSKSERNKSENKSVAFLYFSSVNYMLST